MTLLAIILLLSIGVFIVAFFSPRKGSAAQEISLRTLRSVLQKINKAPKWVRFLTTKPPIYSHKTIHKSADLGKKARKKVGKET